MRPPAASIVGEASMPRSPLDPLREDRIRNEAIVDASPEEQALGWYYYLRERIRFPFPAICAAANPRSPLRKNETATVLRMAPENACEHDILVQIRWQKPKDRRSSLATGTGRRRRIDAGSNQRLALLG